jgi:predicted nucleic acid-binding Zn ribbon protein
MPLYTYINKNTGEEKEVILMFSEMKDEMTFDGEEYVRKPEFCSSFRLKGQGWAGKSKGASLGSPVKQTSVGLKVDLDKKKKIESGLD